MKKMYIVTHGAKEDGSNPAMTEEGFKQIASLRPQLPCSETIVCGTGKRHLDVARALGFTPTRYTAVVGGPESLNSERKIVLSDGTIVESAIYTTEPDSHKAIIALLSELPNDTIICAGRPLMIGLDKKDAKSGKIFIVTFDDNDTITDISEIN